MTLSNETYFLRILDVSFVFLLLVHWDRSSPSQVTSHPQDGRLGRTCEWMTMVLENFSIFYSANSFSVGNIILHGKWG